MPVYIAGQSSPWWRARLIHRQIVELSPVSTCTSASLHQWWGLQLGCACPSRLKTRLLQRTPCWSLPASAWKTTAASEPCCQIGGTSTHPARRSCARHPYPAATALASCTPVSSLQSLCTCSPLRAWCGSFLPVRTAIPRQGLPPPPPFCNAAQTTPAQTESWASELWGGRAPGLELSPGLSTRDWLSLWLQGWSKNLPVASRVLTSVLKSIVLLYRNIL